MSPWEQTIARHIERVRKFPPMQPTSLRVRFAAECLLCGTRRGLHRHGDEVCPNRRWTAGRGEQQWLHSTFTPSAA